MAEIENFTQFNVLGTFSTEIFVVHFTKSFI